MLSLVRSAALYAESRSGHKLRELMTRSVAFTTGLSMGEAEAEISEVPTQSTLSRCLLRIDIMFMFLSREAKRKAKQSAREAGLVRRVRKNWRCLCSDGSTILNRNWLSIAETMAGAAGMFFLHFLVSPPTANNTLTRPENVETQ